MRNQSRAHTELVRDALCELSKAGFLAWENKTGEGWVGKFITRTETGRTVLENARHIAFGLKGSADIIALRGDGEVFFCEAKTGQGRLAPEQRKFRDAVRIRGGRHVEFRDLDGLLAAVATTEREGA